MDGFYSGLDRSTITEYDNLIANMTIRQYKMLYVFAIAQFVVEVIMFFVFFILGSIESSPWEYILFYVLIPTIINIFAILICYKYIKTGDSIAKGTRVTSYSLLTLCSVLYFMHNVFDIVIILFFVPVFMSIVYGAKRLTAGLGIAGVIVKFVLDIIMRSQILYHYRFVEIRDMTTDVINAALYAIVMAVIIIFCLRTIDTEKDKMILTIRLEQEMRDETSVDYLTGILNRKSGEKMIRYSISIKDEGLLFMMDLDEFKNINDSLGHPKGDSVLVETAEIIKSVFRKNDYVCRLGGDEFMVYAPEMEKSLAKSKAEQLLDQLKRSYEAPGGAPIHIGASIGIASFPEDGSDFEKLYSNADRALYEAKKAGKGNYKFYS